MNIAFDAHPLICDKMSGIGYCEAGQVTHIMNMYPDNNYQFQYFSLRNHHIKEQRMTQYMRTSSEINFAKFSGFAYRAIMNFIPLPYSSFFGKSADITHFFNYIVPPSVHGKTVVTVHDMVIKAYPETVRFRTRQMLNIGLEKSMKRADIIVTDSEFSKTEIAKYYPAYSHKVRVVPCGVNLEKFHPVSDNAVIEKTKKNLGISGEYFLYLGTIEPRKNLERLITAYAIFVKRYENPPKLVLAGGKGWLCDGIYNKVHELGIEDYIQFTQYVPSEDMCPLMNGALSFLFPSVYEGFGMPPLEAMACGTPVLTSSEASLPEVVGDSAVIVDAYDIISIANGIERLYNYENLRKKLSHKGIEQSKKYSWENSAEMLYNIYCEAVGTGE